MHLPILSLLMAGMVVSIHPKPTEFSVHAFFTDTVAPVNVGINTKFPEKSLQVIGSSLFENKDSNAVFPSVSLRKSFNGNFRIGSGKTVGAYGFQDGKAFISGITKASESDGVPNVEITFNTTNASGELAERFRITEEGILNYANDMSSLYTERSLVDKAYVDAITGSTLDGTLALGNNTSRPINFLHSVSDPLIRKLVTNNEDSVYQYNGKAYTAQAFTETIQRFDGVNSSGRPNYVWMFGYNQNGGGGRLNTNDASIHLSMETHYESGAPLMELHLPQVQSINGVTQRLLSFTVDKVSGSSFTYFTAGSMEFRSPATKIGGTSPYYASFSPVGIDIINPDPAATTTLSLFSENGLGALKIQSGTGQGFIYTTGSTADLTIQTSRFLNLSNQIQFNNTANEYNNGNVTFDLPSENQTKAFIFRNHGQHPLIEFRDGVAKGTPLITVFGKLKISGISGSGSRLLMTEPDGTVAEVPGAQEGEILKMVAGKPEWVAATSTGWDIINEYSFRTSSTIPVNLVTIPLQDQEAINVNIDFVAIQEAGGAFTANRSILATRNTGITIGTPQDIVAGNNIAGEWDGISYGLEDGGSGNIVVRFQSANSTETFYKAVIRYRKVQAF